MSASSLQKLPGLHAAKKTVLGLFEQQSAVHAVLLFGSEGAAKEELAGYLAQGWLCQNPTAQGPCGECQPCKAFERGNAIDFQMIEPRPPSRIIRLEAIRPSDRKPEDVGTIPLRDFFRTPPLNARHKVVVIRDADRMNADAANAFLKMLEEPHPHAKMILTTSAFSRILPTIRSRCLCIGCETADAEELTRDVPDALKPLVLAGPQLRAQMLETPAPFEALAKLAADLTSADARHALRLSERLRSIADQLQDSLQLQARAANTEALALLGALLAQRDPEHPEWIQALTEAHRRIVGNAQAGVVFDAMFAKMLTSNL